MTLQFLQTHFILCLGKAWLIKKKPWISFWSYPKVTGLLPVLEVLWGFLAYFALSEGQFFFSQKPPVSRQAVVPSAGPAGLWAARLAQGALASVGWREEALRAGSSQFCHHSGFPAHRGAHSASAQPRSRKSCRRAAGEGARKMPVAGRGLIGRWPPLLHP